MQTWERQVGTEVLSLPRGKGQGWEIFCSCSPSHLLLHLRLSEVQGQEVEVLRLLPLSGVRQQVVSIKEDGGGRGSTGGGVVRVFL